MAKLIILWELGALTRINNHTLFLVNNSCHTDQDVNMNVIEYRSVTSLKNKFVKLWDLVSF